MRSSPTPQASSSEAPTEAEPKTVYPQVKQSSRLDRLSNLREYTGFKTAKQRPLTVADTPPPSISCPRNGRMEILSQTHSKEKGKGPRDGDQQQATHPALEVFKQKRIQLHRRK